MRGLKSSLGLGSGLPGLSAPNKGAGVPPVVPFPTIASMYGAWEPSYAGNVVDTLDQTFAPASVDTANSKLAISGLNFGAIVSFNSASGNPIYWDNTGGTLPTTSPQITKNTALYLSPNGSGGYDVYPAGGANDYLATPGMLSFETPLPAQNFAQRTNKIVFLDQGTGTHRIYSDKLVFSMVDMLGNGYTIEGRNGASDRNSHHQVKVDASGEYICSRIIAREYGANAGGTYALFGKSPIQGPSNKRLEMLQRQGGKRCFWHTQVVRLSPTMPVTAYKNIVAASGINTSTGAITYTNANGKFATGNRIQIVADPLGAMPTGFSPLTDYWVFKSGTNTFTIHANPTDAATGANPIIPTTQGTGFTTFWAPERISDYHRQQFFIELLEPNGTQNTLSPGAIWRGPAVNGLLPASAWTTSGTTNGDILNIRYFAGTSTPTKVSYKCSVGGTRPTCQDTGAPLADGDYWVTQYTGGGNTYGRLHRTLAKAQACVGVATSACSNADLIKFSTAPVGESLINWNDDTTPFAFNSYMAASGGGTAQTNGAAPNPIDYITRLPFGLHVVTFLIDQNDPAQATPMGYLIIDGSLVQTYALDGTKGLSGAAAASASAPAFTLHNSAASHVPLEGDSYGTYLGSDTGAVTVADILPLHAYCKSKFKTS